MSHSTEVTLRRLWVSNRVVPDSVELHWYGVILAWQWEAGGRSLRLSLETDGRMWVAIDGERCSYCFSRRDGLGSFVSAFDRVIPRWETGYITDARAVMAAIVHDKNKHRPKCSDINQRDRPV